MKKLLGLIFILSAGITGISIAEDTACLEKCYKEAYQDCRVAGSEEGCGTNYGRCLREKCELPVHDTRSDEQAQDLNEKAPGLKALMRSGILRNN